MYILYILYIILNKNTLLNTLFKQYLTFGIFYKIIGRNIFYIFSILYNYIFQYVFR